MKCHFGVFFSVFQCFEREMECEGKGAITVTSCDITRSKRVGDVEVA